MYSLKVKSGKRQKNSYEMLSICQQVVDVARKTVSVTIQAWAIHIPVSTVFCQAAHICQQSLYTMSLL